MSWQFEVASDASPQDLDLPIRFQDDHLIVVSKPAGMATHPRPGWESSPPCWEAMPPGTAPAWPGLGVSELRNLLESRTDPAGGFGTGMGRLNVFKALTPSDTPEPAPSPSSTPKPGKGNKGAKK